MNNSSPGLIVQATNPATGEPLGGLQRVFLAWGGKGKAQVEKKEQKLSLGPMKGGVARLAEPIEGQPLLIGEGVETVLTAMEASSLPGWSTLGTSGLKAFTPPPGINHVIVLAENDGGPNQKALEVLIPALTAHGVRADVARPPPGLKDFNDCVNGVSGHEAGAGLALVKRAIDAAIAGETRPGAPPIITGDDEQDGKFSMTELRPLSQQEQEMELDFAIVRNPWASRATWRSRAMHLLGGASLFASEIAMGRSARRSFPTERCTAI